MKFVLTWFNLLAFQLTIFFLWYLDVTSGANLLNGFYALDLKSGYWQVPLPQNCKNAFTVGLLGFWWCGCMTFVLTNGLATFQRLMESCMGDLHIAFLLRSYCHLK